MGDDNLAGVQAGLSKESKGQSQLTARSDCELDWFLQHYGSPSLVDMR